jgi:hypothetical protein
MSVFVENFERVPSVDASRRVGKNRVAVDDVVESGFEGCSRLADGAVVVVHRRADLTNPTNGAVRRQNAVWT